MGIRIEGDRTKKIPWISNPTKKISFISIKKSVGRLQNVQFKSAMYKRDGQGKD